MNQYLEYLPIALFAIAYMVGGIYWATATLMVAVTAQVLIMALAGMRISNLLKFTLGASLLFGSLTLVLRDPLFLQWKPTIVTWAMAGALLVGQFVLRRNLVRSMLGGELNITEEGWSRLSLAWALGLVAQGGINLYVAFNFSMDFWVAFKLVGMLSLNLLLAAGTLGWLAWAGHLKLPNPEAP